VELAVKERDPLGRPDEIQCRSACEILSDLRAAYPQITLRYAEAVL
jgi:hypothetical protein